MSMNCEKELIEHNTQIKNMQDIFDKNSAALNNSINVCEKEKKNLIKINNKLNLDNLNLQETINTNNDIQDNLCEQKIEKRRLKMEESINNLSTITGGYSHYLDKIEKQFGNGIIYQMKTNLKNNYEKEVNNFKNLYNNKLKGGGNQVGGNPILYIVISVIKIMLMTVGTFFFSWWPIMFLVSLYCVYVEYKMVKLTSDSIVGVPILYILCAYFCPCCWAIGRLVMGWTTNMGTSPNLFNVFSKCTEDGFTINFSEYYGRDCKDNKCVWTTNECFGALFDKEGSLLDNITQKVNTMTTKK